MENPLNSPKSYFSGQNLTKTHQEKKHWCQMNTLQTLHVSRCVVVRQTKANCRHVDNTIIYYHRKAGIGNGMNIEVEWRCTTKQLSEPSWLARELKHNRKLFFDITIHLSWVLACSIVALPNATQVSCPNYNPTQNYLYPTHN